VMLISVSRSDSRRFTLGIGMVIGTLFTLFVVSALYTVVASERGAIDC